MLTSNCASQQMDVLTKFSNGKKLLQIFWAGWCHLPGLPHQRDRHLLWLRSNTSTKQVWVRWCQAHTISYSCLVLKTWHWMNGLLIAHGWVALTSERRPQTGELWSGVITSGWWLVDGVKMYRMKANQYKCGVINKSAPRCCKKLARAFLSSWMKYCRKIQTEA